MRRARKQQQPDKEPTQPEEEPRRELPAQDPQPQSAVAVKQEPRKVKPSASPARQVEATARETALDTGSHVNAAGGMEKSLSTRGKLTPMATVEAGSR